MALEVVRAGARLVRAGARRDDAVLPERAEGALDVLRGVDGAQPGEDVQGVLAKVSRCTRSRPPRAGPRGGRWRGTSP